MENEYNFVIVIKNIKDPNGFVSGGMSNKYKGAYKKIFDILDEDSIFVQAEVEDEILKGNDFYLYFNSFPDTDKLQRISKIPNVEILNKNFAKGGLIAPNGKPSNLTPEQYKLVRSEAFLNWFGDWINDPANASKVVDENGEPLVVYHGTTKDFTIFEMVDKVKEFEFGVGIRDYGAYFTNNKKTAQFYSLDYNKKTKESKLIEKKFQKALTNWLETKSEIDLEIVRDLSKKRVELGKDILNIFEQKNILMCFLNIKKPFVFDAKGKHWYKVLFGKVDIALLNKNDGVIMENMIESNSIIQNTYIIFEPSQIKIADGTNTEFDSSSDDIRFEQGGETKSGTPDYLEMFLGK